MKPSIRRSARVAGRERIAQNFEVFNFELDAAEMKAIEALDTGVSLFSTRQQR